MMQGADVEGTIDGVAFVGTGNFATAVSGNAKGLVLSFAAGTGPNAHLTVSGPLGNITVANNALQFQIGPNQYQTAFVAIDRVLPVALGIGVTGNQFNNLGEIDVTSALKAQDSIGVIDSAIDDVTRIRGFLGAFQQNTLESTSNNLRATLENTVNAESVIRDTDFAEEIAEFTKHQVLVQAGTSVLSSANQTSQLVLSLLS
jgi:flagellin